MRILWLSHLIPYPPKGGVLQRSFNLLKQVSQYHDVDLMAFNQVALLDPILKEGPQAAFTALSDFCTDIEFFEIPNLRNPRAVTTLVFKSLFFEPYNISWLKSGEFSFRLSRRIENYSYDLVHFDTISLLPYFKLLPTSVATCLDHHNIESYMLRRRACNEKNVLKKAYFRQEGIRLGKYERSYCPQFSLNITCSDIDTTRLLEIAPNANVLTIPNGVDLEYFKPLVNSQDNRIIFVGTMNWYPNIEAVLYLAKDIWPLLKAKNPSLVCDIIGANPPAIVRDLANECSDFHIHGFVDDVRPFIRTAAVYVCPIRDGGGTKLKVLDAMAMGKAIVAHPIACEGIRVTHDVNVLIADGAKQFVDSITTLIANPSKRKALGSAARTLVENLYGYDAIGLQLSEAFEHCLR